MENVVSINHTKENVLEFEATFEGVDTKNIETKFVIKTKDMELSFAANKVKGDKWSVKVPPLSMLEKTAYKCYIAVVADGYYFEPLKGTLNVVGTAQVYTTTPKNAKLETTEPVEQKKPDPKKKVEDDKKKADLKEKIDHRTGREKPIAQIAKELMEQNKSNITKQPVTKAEPLKTEVKAEPLKTEVKAEPLKTEVTPEIKVDSKKDEKIHNILKEAAKKKAEQKPEPKKPSLRIMEEVYPTIPKTEPVKIEKKVEPVKVIVEKTEEELISDQKKKKVHDILKEAGIKIAQTKPKMKFSISNN